ncbi:hypothetical protein PROFUN_01902 [Planoprotostelium fungivorum]|uniref:Dynactin subunit 3 n=1 Tax=Planoprotostelium fungivorum TaxID=1890364 RepID=A0A2P6NZ09_9EUKA|nr:hypothetical protein PROFUN_01902 [Planoprotostelium fungivorum]
MSETEVTLDSLSQRLRRLEEQLVGGEKTGTDQRDLIETIGIIQKQATDVLNTPGVSTFLDTYAETRPILENPVSSDILGVLSKQSIVLSSEGRMRQSCRDLETIQSLDPYINSERLRAVPQLIERLVPLEIEHLKQCDDVSTVNTRHLEDLLNAYNDIISLLSEKFVYWDSSINAWEKKLDTLKNK